MTLAEHILANNKYFQKGFDNAFIQDGVYARDGRDLLRIFPNDNYGNFFYILGANRAEYHQVGQNPLMYQDIQKMTLVAVVDNANPEQVVSNIRSTLLTYKNINVTSASWNREIIVIDQLKGIGIDKIQQALQRLKNETIVQIEFTNFRQFVPSNCEIKNPCENGCL